MMGFCTLQPIKQSPFCYLRQSAALPWSHGDDTPRPVRRPAPDNSSDAKEKQLIGEAWATVSDGKAVFVMVTMERKDPDEVRHSIRKVLERDPVA